MAIDPRRIDLSTPATRKLISENMVRLQRMYQDASPLGMATQAASLRDASEEELDRAVRRANAIHCVPWRVIGPAIGVSAQAAQRKYKGWSKMTFKYLEPKFPQRQAVPNWLTSVRSDPPELVGAIGLSEACAAAGNDARRAVAASWEVLKLSAMDFSRAFYADISAEWSSDIVATFRRAEEDGRLPEGATAVAEAVHHYHVGAQGWPEELPPTGEVLQLVVLAYRLAWQTRDILIAAGA
ncbi:hypothetical protein OG426_26035 [Streptomyces canus]|uniref:hypothetical protein n=1 Tax=Streptomyces canus TaxID=58343 RepID=UPI00386D4D26|nr:hypothetical protein OG426_26035 [Streptomyces canus]